MARLLHDDGSHDDLCEDLRDESGSCSATSGSDSCHSGSGGHSGSDSCRSGSHRCDDSSDGDRHHHRRHRRHRNCHHHRLIPVGNVSVDCTPVTFRTPGQAMNVVSCSVSQTVTVPITQTQNVQVPTNFGCFVCVPVTQTVQVPVTTTVNVPPVLVPVPRVVCPPNAALCQAVESCLSPCPATC
jgi:hypothetical protein